MKDYNEMAESVLQQAKIRAAQRKHRRRVTTGLIAATLCVAILIAVVGVGLNRNPTDGTISTEPTQQDIIQPGKVYFLTANKEGDELTLMQPNMTLPTKSIIRVRSLKDLTKSEIAKAVSEESAYRAAFADKYGNSDGGVYAWTQSDDVIIQYLSGGKASLILPDGSQIESVDRETTGMLGVEESWGGYDRDVTFGEGENAVTIPKGSYRAYLGFHVTGVVHEIFKNDPDTPLSTIRDTITVTINYKNGTKQIILIDVTLDDEGNVYMTQRENNTAV